jgi:hypothetical protein
MSVLVDASPGGVVQSDLNLEGPKRIQDVEMEAIVGRVSRRKQWTADDIRALGVRMDGVTACEIVYGVGRTTAYELLGRREVDFPVLRRGKSWIVPTSAVLSLLRVEGEQAA